MLHAKLTSRACSFNQAAAMRGWAAIIDDVPLGMIEDADLDRLVACGACEKSGLDEVDVAIVAEALQSTVKELTDRLEGMDWDRGDHEVKEPLRKARLAEYRKNHRTERIAYNKLYRYRTNGYLPQNYGAEEVEDGEDQGGEPLQQP